MYIYTVIKFYSVCFSIVTLNSVWERLEQRLILVYLLIRLSSPFLSRASISVFESIKNSERLTKCKLIEGLNNLIYIYL